jgi:hypothetical protein
VVLLARPARPARQLRRLHRRRERRERLISREALQTAMPPLTTALLLREQRKGEIG